MHLSINQEQCQTIIQVNTIILIRIKLIIYLILYVSANSDANNDFMLLFLHIQLNEHNLNKNAHTSCKAQHYNIKH